MSHAAKPPNTRFGVQAAAYVVRVLDCQQRVLFTLDELDLTGPREVLLHEGAPPATPAASGFRRLAYPATP